MASYYSGTPLTREQTAQLAYQAGFRGTDLVNMVAIAGRESQYIANAHRTDSTESSNIGDRGLWQINSVWDAKLIAAGIIKDKTDLYDPAVNAQAAMFVFKNQGIQAWAPATGAGAGNPLYGTNVAAAQQAVQSTIGQAANAPMAAAGAGATFPSDTKLIRNDNGLWAVYDVGGVQIYYSVSDSQASGSGLPIQRMSNAQFSRLYPNSVSGGRVEELADVRGSYGSFAAMWKSVLDKTIGSTNPARNDKGVIKALAQFVARPDMEDAELQNLLRATPWWNQHTEGQLEWNGLSEAEKNVRRQDTLVKMAQQWNQFAGENISVTDPRLQSLVEKVASGEMGLGQWTETFLKPRAMENPESPWARQQRDEQEAQRQRPIDIENTVNQLRSTLDRWGLSWSEATLHKYGVALMNKTMSDDDITKMIQDQATVKYSWKTDPKMETATAAAPWIEVYNRLMEQQGSLRTPEIANTLSRMNTDPDNNNPAAFEERLMRNPRWADTKNGAEAITSGVAELGSLLGFK